MFPIFIQRTSNAISVNLNHKCNHVKLAFFRLYKRSYFGNLINRAWNNNTLGTFWRYPEEYKHFIWYRKYNTELHEIDENHIFLTKHIPEHKVLHSLLEKSVHYENTIMRSFDANIEVSYEEICELYTTDWSRASMLYIYDAIKKVSYCYLSGTRFEITLYDSILKAYNNKLCELQDQQIKTLMQHLSVISFDSSKSYYWKLFLKTLNNECLKRFFPSTTEEMLLISDAFYQIGDHNSYYTWRALRKLSTKPNKLSAKHLVQLLFLLNFSKLPNSSINMFEMECRAKECISDLSANEIGILTRGFFMAKRKIKNKDLIREIIIRVRKNIKFMESNTLASVMKLIRYSGCKNCLSEFQELTKSLNTEIPRLSLKCLTHIAHASGGIRVYDEPLIKNILEKVKNEVTAARIKDIERILFAIYSVAPCNNYYQEMCQILLNEILSNYQTVRATEINMFPVTLVRVIMYVTGRGIYVPQLIQHVMDPEYIRNMHKGNLNLVTNDMLILQCSIKIEFPDYKGPFLTNAVYNYLIKKFLRADIVQYNNVRFQTEVIFICKRYLGINVCIDYILPHYTVKDIVFGFDEHNNSVEIEPILSSMPISSIKYVNTENLKNIRWNVLYPVSAALRVIGRNDYVGPVHRKIKQLQAIGYTPLVVDEVEWNLFTEDKDKENYLRKLIYEKHNFQNLLNSKFEDCNTTKK